MVLVSFSLIRAILIHSRYRCPSVRVGPTCSVLVLVMILLFPLYDIWIATYRNFWNRGIIWNLTKVLNFRSLYIRASLKQLTWNFCYVFDWPVLCCRRQLSQHFILYFRSVCRHDMPVSCLASSVGMKLAIFNLRKEV